MAPSSPALPVARCPAAALKTNVQQSLLVRSGPQDDAVPALMTLKSALTLLLLMASRQAEITWFLGFPTGHNGRRQMRFVIQLQHH